MRRLRVIGKDPHERDQLSMALFGEHACSRVAHVDLLPHVTVGVSPPPGYPQPTAIRKAHDEESLPTHQDVERLAFQRVVITNDPNLWRRISKVVYSL